MSEAKATGVASAEKAKALALDFSSKGFNVRIIGPVDQVETRAASGSKWLVVATKEATFSQNFG